MIKRKILASCVQFNDEIKQGKMSVLDVPPIVKRLGLDGVECREVYWHNKEQELPALKRQVAELGLAVTYATFNPLQAADEQGRQLVLTDIEDAAALGSPLLRVFRGPNPPPGQEDIVFGGVAAAIKRASDLGVVLALENHSGALGCRLVDVKEAIDRFSPLGLRVNVDTSNYVLNGQDLLGAIRLFSPLIVYSHLKDVRETAQGRSATFLGNGTLDLAPVLAEYERTGRDFPLCFEFGGGGDPEGAIARSLAHLQRLMAG